MVDELRQSGFDPDWRRVDNEDDFLACLNPVPDVVLADYSLPEWDAPSALHALQARGLDVPFVIVSGTVGEDVAVECIKRGATDYLLKDRLTRLGPAVVRSLEDRNLRREKQQAEAALHASETRYRRLFEAAQDGILILDAQTGQIVDANPFLTGRLGYSRSGILAKKIWEIGVFQDVIASQDTFRRLVETGYGRYADLPLETRDGRQIAVEFVSNVYQVDGKTVVQCNIRDITERRQAEHQIAELAAIVQSSQDAIIGKHLNGIITSWNQGAERIYGYTESEVVGRSMSILIPPDRAAELPQNSRPDPIGRNHRDL